MELPQALRDSQLFRVAWRGFRWKLSALPRVSSLSPLARRSRSFSLSLSVSCSITSGLQLMAASGAAAEAAKASNTRQLKRLLEVCCPPIAFLDVFFSGIVH